MGWTFSNNKPSDVTPVEYVTKECLDWKVSEAAKPKVVATATGASGTIAMAVRFPKEFMAERGMDFASPYILEPDGSFTMAFVFLTKRAKGYYSFGYKDMTETMGPYEGVSASILPHLSALDMMNGGQSAKWAQAWRARCVAFSEQRKAVSASKAKLVPGVEVTLASPLKFRGGFLASTFKAEQIVRKGKKKMCFRASNGVLCSLRAADLAGATIG